MKQNERDIQRKLRILIYAEEVGSAVKACRYFEPDVMRDYSMFEASSRGSDLEPLCVVMAASNRAISTGIWCCSGCAIVRR